MRRASGIRNYFDEYLELCYATSPKSELLVLCKLLKEDHALSSLHLPSAFWLIDYSKRQYVYMKGHCLEIHNYSKNKYLQGNFDFHPWIWVPEDKAVFEEQIFQDIREYWNLIRPGKFFKYRFSFNSRYYRSDGIISQFLQHSIYLESQGNLPVLSILYFSSAADDKTDNTIVLTIERLVTGKGYQQVFSKSYLPQKKPTISLRESEVLRLSFEGMSSKMIADRLCISEQTVKNHKRNMMEKTSAKNIVELINFSLKNNWL